MGGSNCDLQGMGNEGNYKKDRERLFREPGVAGQGGMDSH